MKLISVTSLIAAMFGYSSITMAINSSTVCNNTQWEPIAVDWTAQGCVGVKYHHSYTCEGVILAHGECHTHKYKWGNTDDNIHIGTYITQSMLDTWGVKGEPGYYVAANGYGNCQHHSDNGAVFSITNLTAVLVKSRPTADCDISKH